MKRALIAFLTFGIVMAGVAGFAASLNIGTPSSIGADSDVVAACDNVTVSWGTPTYVSPDYKITTVKITEDLADGSTQDCNLKTAKVTVAGQSASGAMDTTGTTGDMTLTNGGVRAEDISSVAVVVG